MIRNTVPIKRVNRSMDVSPMPVSQALSVLLSRMQYSAKLGETYGGKRDLYQALGYKKQLNFEDYYRQYKREDIGKVVIDKPVNAVWSTKPQITDKSDKDTVSEFEQAWDDLVTKFKVYSVLSRADKLTGIGEYGVLLFGFDDTTDFSQEVSGSPDLLYIHPYSCNAATIQEFEKNPASPRFNQPLFYQIQINQPQDSIGADITVSTKSIKVHYTRVIHIVEDPLESLIYGTPRLMAIFNRLQDIQKVLGGSAEMFWRNASPGKVANLDKDAKLGKDDLNDLRKQFDEYEHHLRRVLRTQGMQISELTGSIASPKDALDVQLSVVSILTGIPKRILMGSERGELASSQDEKTWNKLVANRMEDHAEPAILRPFIDKLIEYKILPEPTGGEYYINWPKMSTLGDKEKSEIGLNKTKAYSEYLKAPGGLENMPLEVFLREILLFEEEVVDEIMTTISQYQQEENEDFVDAEGNQTNGM